MVDMGTRKDRGGAAPAAGAGSHPARGRSRWTVTVAALAGLLVVLLVGGVVLLSYGRGAEDRAAQRPVVLDTARRFATDLATINGSNAQAKVQSLIQNSTGTYREHLTQHANDIQSSLAATSTTSSSVIGAGLEVIDGESATALVVLSSGPPGAQFLQDGGPLPMRLSIQLQRDGGRWLVSAVEGVQ